jgi:hypothetical protein
MPPNVKSILTRLGRPKSEPRLATNRTPGTILLATANMLLDTHAAKDVVALEAGPLDARACGVVSDADDAEGCVGLET